LRRERTVAAVTLDVLYEDNHLLAVLKPPNVPVQADESGDPDLLSIARAYIKERYKKPGAVYLGLVHRLDRPVGGVMVFARTSKAAQRLQETMQSGSWSKIYLAVVCGSAPKQAALTDYLYKDETTRTSSVVDEKTQGAKIAHLSFQKLAEKASLSLLAVVLDTGRHHQIRVQLTHAGFPIWGDARYNEASKPGQQIALWAAKLAFDHPTTKERMALAAPLPPANS
jgi:23S rRNA pseudouridine1911/1915/1917 synthase